MNRGSQDSAVVIVTGYGLDLQGVGVRVPVGSRIFSMSSRPALGPTQASYPMGTGGGGFFHGGKEAGHEADHSPPASAEVKKNVDLYRSTLP
jgi:hypothetical protein